MNQPRLPKKEDRSTAALVGCALAALAVFAFDIALPLGVAGGVPYVAVILLALWSPRPRVVLWVAVACSVLTVLGYIVSPPGGTLWVVLMNRGLALFAIAVTAGVGVRWKLAEQETLSLQAQVLESQRLESLSLLSGGIAHDFNNLLAGIMGNADLALSNATAEGDHDHELELEEILAASKKAADLCRQLLAYTGGGVHRKVAINLSDVVRELPGVTDRSGDKAIRFSLELGKHLPPIEGDLEQIKQVITNVLINASEAIGESEGKGDRSIRIATYEANLTPEVRDNLSVSSLPSTGGILAIEIADKGEGMDDETLARLFDPFFSTKFTGRGLGMAAVQGIVQGHQGGIEVESERGRGTTVRMFFPIYREAAAQAEARVKEGPIRRTSRRILIVDDEEAVRNLAQRLLESAGYEVDLAENGETAIQRFSESKEGYDALLLDLTMPGMSGDEVLVQIRARDGSIPVVVSSGYGDADVQRVFAGMANIEFVPKPYLKQALLDSFTKILGNSNPPQA